MGWKQSWIPWETWGPWLLIFFSSMRLPNPLYLFQAVYSWSWHSYWRHSEERVIILKPSHMQIKMETIFRLNIKGQYDSVYWRLELKVRREAGRGGICSRAEITPFLPMCAAQWTLDTMSFLPCSFWNLKSTGGDSNQVDTLANKELQIVQGILGKWMGLLRHGSLQQGPETLVVCVHIIAIACWPGAMSFMLSNPSKDVGRLLPFYARFPDWVTESAPSFPREAELRFAVIVTGIQMGDLGAWHM